MCGAPLVRARYRRPPVRLSYGPRARPQHSNIRPVLPNILGERILSRPPKALMNRKRLRPVGEPPQTKFPTNLLDHTPTNFLSSKPQPHLGSPMFERFTERARQVVVLAQEEARTLKHNYIGTEHILLGLLREEEGLAARVLESLDITVERVRAQVVRIVGSGEGVTYGQIPFTPRAKKVLELALREALSLGHNYIGTEHILLGLVRENEGVAARILLDFDADSEKIRNEVIRMLSGPGSRQRGSGAGASAGAAGQSEGKKSSKLLDQFGRNLTKLAAEGKLDPVVGRETEIERIMQILSRRTKNNPVLVGE